MFPPLKSLCGPREEVFLSHSGFSLLWTLNSAAHVPVAGRGLEHLPCHPSPPPLCSEGIAGGQLTLGSGFLLPCLAAAFLSKVRNELFFFFKFY